MNALKFKKIKERAVMVLTLALVFTVNTGFNNLTIEEINQAPSKNEQFKLIVGKTIEIVKIDGNNKFVKSGKTLTLPVGHHTIIYNRTIRVKSGAMLMTRKDMNKEIELEFLAGKTYIIDGPAQINLDPFNENLNKDINQDVTIRIK